MQPSKEPWVNKKKNSHSRYPRTPKKPLLLVLLVLLACRLEGIKHCVVDKKTWTSYRTIKGGRGSSAANITGVVANESSRK